MALINILVNVEKVVIEFQITSLILINITIIRSTKNSNYLRNFKIAFPFMLNIPFFTNLMRPDYTDKSISR